MNKIKEQLLDTVAPRKAPGGFKPDKNRLKRPFEKKESVMWVFCEGCGLDDLEVSKKMVEHYAEDSQQEAPPEEEMKDYFVYIKACSFCERTNINDLEFWRIDDLPDPGQDNNI